MTANTARFHISIRTPSCSMPPVSHARRFCAPTVCISTLTATNCGTKFCIRSFCRWSPNNNDFALSKPDAPHCEASGFVLLEGTEDPMNRINWPIFVAATLFLLTMTHKNAVQAAEAAPLFPKDARILFQGDSITDGNRGRSADPN